MKTPTIKEEWEAFAKAIFEGVSVNEVQRREMRLAFYGGCSVLFFKLTNTAGDDNVSEASGEEMMKAIDAELRQFSEDVKAGRA